jgi:hypothetical protein
LLCFADVQQDNAYSQGSFDDRPSWHNLRTSGYARADLHCFSIGLKHESLNFVPRCRSVWLRQDDVLKNFTWSHES